MNKLLTLSFLSFSVSCGMDKDIKEEETTIKEEITINEKEKQPEAATIDELVVEWNLDTHNDSTEVVRYIFVSDIDFAVEVVIRIFEKDGTFENVENLLNRAKMKSKILHQSSHRNWNTKN